MLPIIECIACLTLNELPLNLTHFLLSIFNSGILLKGGALFDQLQESSIVALDKTGTLTIGKWNIFSTMDNTSTLARRTILSLYFIFTTLIVIIVVIMTQILIGAYEWLISCRPFRATP